MPIREGRKYRARRQRRETVAYARSRSKAIALFAGAAAVGVGIGVLTIPTRDGPSIGSAYLRQVAQTQGLLDDQGKATWTWYRNCAQARAAGVAPLQRSELGYRSALDADNDGIACEPYYGD